MADNLFSEDWAVVGVIDPDAYTASTYLTAAIDMSLWEQLAVITMAGDMGNGASVVTSVTASATSGGSYVAISGKTTTLGVSGGSPTTDSNEQTVIHVRSEEVTSNKRYIKVSMQVTDATSDAGLIVLGKARLKPAYDNDLASVDEIVN